MNLIHQGWYIVTYALAIYHLNLLLAFLTPKIDPALAHLEDEDPNDGLELPTKQNDEFRPFIRRLPEFKFWYSATKATVIAFTCTFFDFFNIPVFWPILVMYFITLFCITMKRQIKVRLFYALQIYILKLALFLKMYFLILILNPFKERNEIGERSTNLAFHLFIYFLIN